MALNKRKVLETARKYAQKGAKAKALKEYNKLLKADPRDAKLLLEVGDAYRRWGQAEEAIAQYGKVAQQYRQDGFDARAVAVFKQILNLDPKHYAAYVSLSELYQRMGLDSEAISALQTAADGYHKEGRKAEALDLLRQTAALDPTNTTSRLKVADLLRQEEMNTEAISEYRAVAEELDNQGDREQVLVVLERILEIEADDLETLTSLTKNLMASGELDRAEVFAIRMLNVSTEPSQYELLMELYSQGGDEAKLADATRGLAKLHRDRGDEETARTLMQRLPVDEVGSSSRMAVDVSEVAEPELEDDELLEEEPFLTLDDEADSDARPLAAEEDLLEVGGDEIDLETEAPQPGDPIEPVPLPEGDPDQLLAEANVYLRYGKRDQAIASLLGVLAQDAVHRAALEKLGEAYAADDQNGPAVAAWTRAAVEICKAGDAEALTLLKEQVALIDPAAAEQLGSVAAVAASGESEASEVGVGVGVELDLDVEVDLNLDTAIGEVAGSETQSGLSVDLELDGDVSVDADLSASDDNHSDNNDDDEFEIEIDDDAFEVDVEVETGSLSDSVSQAETGGVVDSVAASAEGESVEFDFDVDELSSPGTDAATGQSTTTAAKIVEELEEAEFYLAQDMFDEAEGILSRILALVPNHPSAMLRMGELAAARGEAPDLDVAAAASNAPIVDAAELTFNGVTEGLDEVAAAVNVEGADIEIDIDVDIDADIDIDVDTETDAGTNVETNVDVAGVVERAQDDAGGELDDDTASDVVAEAADLESELVDETAPMLDEDASGEQTLDAADDGESFDLREALADVLSDDEEKPTSDETSGVLSTVEDGFGSIFSDFKKGVTATLEEGDFETRYDLGIAYREMELYEDALGEFRFCLDSPDRRFDSLHLMGVCARDLARFGDAVNHFEQALALPEIPTERLAAVYFDLALAQQGGGEVERACASLRQTLELQSDFPTAAKRLNELEAAGETSPTLGEPGEGFESFDDLFETDDDEEGDEAMVEAVPVETFESFDDVVAEAEVIEESTEVSAAVEAAVIAPASDDATKSAKKSGRKKISFI